MWTRALLKQNAKTAFKRNYWGCVAVCTLVLLLSGAFFTGTGFSGGASVEQQNMNYDPAAVQAEVEKMLTMFQELWNQYWMLIILALLVASIMAIGVSVVFYNVLQIGMNRYFLENREHKTSIGQLFYGFTNGKYGSNVWVMFLRTFYTWAWSLLFYIPGIIKSYSYMLVPYILAENPNLDSKRVIELSRKMMYGHKWEAFVLQWSFIGWMIASMFTPMGLLSILYVNPYMQATYAEFYSAVKAKARMNGIIQKDELPTMLVPEV